MALVQDYTYSKQGLTIIPYLLSYTPFTTTVLILCYKCFFFVLEIHDLSEAGAFCEAQK